MKPSLIMFWDAVSARSLLHFVLLVVRQRELCVEIRYYCRHQGLCFLGNSLGELDLGNCFWELYLTGDNNRNLGLSSERNFFVVEATWQRGCVYRKGRPSKVRNWPLLLFNQIHITL